MCIKMFTKRKSGESFTKRLLDIDYKELNKLVNEPTSFIKLVKCNHHLSLHPFHLANVKKSIDAKLSEEFCSYNKKLGGIILGSQNVRVLESVAPINADMCFIHVDVEVEFFVFTPAVEQVHKGVVNKQGREQLSCLVHKIFNVFIPNSNDGEEEWLGANAHAGQEIEFRITYIDLESRLPYIRGELLSIISDDSGVSTGEEQLETPKKKKSEKNVKMKKRKLSETLEESFDEAPVMKKKKTSKSDTIKAKKSSKKTNGDEVAVDDSIVKTEIEETPLRKSNKKKHSFSEEIFTEEEPIKTETEVKEEIESEAEIAKKPKKKKKKDKTKDEELYTDVMKSLNKRLGKNNSFDTSQDLNISSLFDELKYLNVSNPVVEEDKMPTSGGSKNITLPLDSDLEEILKDMEEKPNKKKGTKRKKSVVESRDSEDDFVQPVKKVKRKSK